MAPEDCTTCGACCFSENVRHVRVSGEDYARLGEDAEDWVIWVGNEAYLRRAELTSDGGDGPPVIHACAALRIEGGRFLCAIYERRPATCRDLERGGPACAAEREAKAVRPRRVLAVLGGR